MPDIKCTITLPSSLLVRNVGGKAININLAEAAKHPNAMSEAFLGGLLTTLTNTFNSGGTEATESTKVANLKRRIEQLEKGVWVSKGGPRESLVGAMRDCWYDEQGAKDSAGRTKADKAIRAAVTEAFGEKEAATFPTYLRAVATMLGRNRKLNTEQVEAIHTKLVDKYEALGQQLLADRAKAKAETTIDVDAMLDGITID